MAKRLLGLAFLIATMASSAMAAQPRIVSQGPTNGGWRFILYSPAAQREFRVQVAEPDRPPWRRRKEPAIYVLDGDSRFKPVRAAALDLAARKRMAPAFVVAIGYPPGTKVQDQRLHDMVRQETPRNGQVMGGGGAAFQTFVVDELRPFIEARYRVDGRRSVLMGHSVGGLFAARVMADTPEAFGGYFIASPSLQFDPGLIARLGSTAGGGRRVFIAVGGDEGPMVALAQRLAATMGGAGASFVVKDQVFSGQGHMSVLGPMTEPGLSFLLPPKGR